MDDLLGVVSKCRATIQISECSAESGLSSLVRPASASNTPLRTTIRYLGGPLQLCLNNLICSLQSYDLHEAEGDSPFGLSRIDDNVDRPLIGVRCNVAFFGADSGHLVGSTGWHLILQVLMPYR